MPRTSTKKNVTKQINYFPSQKNGAQTYQRCCTDRKCICDIIASKTYWQKNVSGRSKTHNGISKLKTETFDSRNRCNTIIGTDTVVAQISYILVAQAIEVITRSWTMYTI